jgi:hypothetical protein
MSKSTKTDVGVEKGLKLLCVGTLLFLAYQAIHKPAGST